MLGFSSLASAALGDDGLSEIAITPAAVTTAAPSVVERISVNA